MLKENKPLSNSQAERPQRTIKTKTLQSKLHPLSCKRRLNMLKEKEHIFSFVTWVAITRVNWEKKDGSVRIKESGFSSTKWALTASLSSWRKAQTVLAFDSPTLFLSTFNHQIRQSKFSTHERRIHTLRCKEENRVNTHEVVAKVSNFNSGSVDDGDASDSTKNEILEGFWASRSTIKQTDARVFKSRLTYFSPDPAIRGERWRLGAIGRWSRGFEGLPELAIVLGFRGLRHCWFLLVPFHEGFFSGSLLSYRERDSKRLKRCRGRKKQVLRLYENLLPSCLFSFLNSVI